MRSVHVGLLFLLCTTPLSAQETRGTVVLGGGLATTLGGVRSSAVTLAPSVTWTPDASTTLLVGGRVLRYGTGEWSGSALAGLEARARLGGPFAFRVRASGDGTRTSTDLAVLVAGATPAFEARFGPITLSAGGYGGISRSTSPSSAPSGLPAPAPSRREALTRSGLGPEGAVTLTTLTSGALARVTYQERHLFVAGGTASDRTLTAELASPRIALAGSGGHRSERGEGSADGWYGSARAMVALSSALSLIASAEQYPSNPLTGTEGGRAASLALAWRSGGVRGPRPLPRPSGVSPAARGTVRLVLSAPEASLVEVAGDWNRWTPIAARRAGNGVWYVDLTLPAGTWRYAFRVDGRAWTVPDGIESVDDGFGGRSAWLVVRPAGPTG